MNLGVIFKFQGGDINFTEKGTLQQKAAKSAFG